MNTGKRIGQRRRQLNMSQEELAHRMGTNQKQISRYENDVNDPSGDKLVELARALNTSTDWLLGLVDNPERPLPSADSLSEYEREIMMLLHERDEEYQRRVADFARISTEW